MMTGMNKTQQSSNGLVSTPSKADVILDEAKLVTAVANEQGEVFVLQWLSKVETALKGLNEADLLEVQNALEKSLIKLICPLNLKELTDPSPAGPQNMNNNSTSTVPKPGRPSRHLIARCFVTLFSRGESRSLYDVMQALIQIAGEEGKGKVLPEKESRAAALYVAGELFLSSGHNVMSQFIALITLCQRLFRNTASPVLTRYHALTCLSKVLKSGSKSLGEQTARELIKPLKQGLSDRAGAIARGCSDCLLVILEDTNYLYSLAEVEAILSLCFKTLDTADFVTMRAISRLSSALLSSTQKENVVQPPLSTKKKSKKKKEGQDDSSDEEIGPTTPHSAGMEGSSRTLMSPKTMLNQISSAMLRPSTTQRGRGALLDVYASLLEKLGSIWVQTNYTIVISSLLDDIPNHTRGTSSRSDVLSIRCGVAIILRKVIGERMLDEPAQVGAIQEICDIFLKRWPVLMPGQQPPTKYTLVLAFNETSGLLAQLGSAPPQVLDALQQPLLRCLTHPSHSVQISAACCLRRLCSINPLQLSSLLKDVLSELKRDITSLQSTGERGGAELSKRATGRARGLAALISVISHRPLYASFDISVPVLELAFDLLKRSAEHSLSVSAIEIQVAWTLIGALMSLGPEFVRDHLAQLLNMWRSALPKVGEGNVTRSDSEWSFLLHVRECTLGSILSFLTHNGTTLVTLDTARRLIALLSNSLSFVNAFTAQHPTLAQEQIPGTERSQLSLLDREQMVRRRVFQCFVKLSNSPALEAIQESLVAASIQTFAEPDRYIGSAAQAAIAASSGNFTSVWQLADGYAYGVNSLMKENECKIAYTTYKKGSDLLNRDAIESALNSLQKNPIIGAAEHDPIVLYTTSFEEEEEEAHQPVPPPTAAVDAAIELFASLIPFQKRDVQVSSFEILLSYSRSAKLEKNPARRMAVQVNACTAILGALRIAMNSSGGRKASGFSNDRLTSAIRILLLDTLIQGDISLRSAASEAFGRLAAISGSHAMSSQVQVLVDQVVSNRDPDARAGCAMAFGAIYQEVGGLAAGPLTKTVVDILMSLASDPHPTVYFTALDALRMVVDAASLSYSAYVTSSLGMLVKLYMLSTHEPEGGSAGSVNLRADLPANQAICRVINSLIGVLGPDLQEASKVRILILILLKELSQETDEGVVVESTKAMQHFTLFASEHVDLCAWMQSLQLHLKSKNRPLKVAAINAFYQLIQRDALLVSKACGNQLVEQFFALLDGDADTDGIRQVLRNWLRQTADLSPNGWIDLCQKVSRSAGISNVNTSDKVTKNRQSVGGVGVLQDEEAATIDLGDDGSSLGQAGQQSRWRTQLFALQCIHEVFATVKRAGKIEHFDTPRQSGQLSNRVGDLIRMAFTASTALNIEIRLEGLTVLRDVIDNFKNARDPDFDEALLLEQHQAPIAAALTPAFSGDSTPEVLARAVQVCAVFVGSGVVHEVDKLGRILKLLTKALENCLQSNMSSMGDVTNLSTNAAAMLKIAVFAAWAQLQVASAKQSYLLKVVEPQLSSLATMWVRCLAEYANLRADSEGTGMAIAPLVNPVLDTPFAGLIRAILVPHHQRAWPIILNAVAVLMGHGDKNVISAMQGGESKTDSESVQSQSEPVMYFYPLYGLAYEALATGSGSSRETHGVRTTLLALRYLCNTRFAGSVLLQDDLFEELIDLSYRIIMTESANIQIRVIEMIATFVKSYGKQLYNQSIDQTENGQNLVPFIKLTTCLRLTLFSIQNAQSKSSAQASSAEDRASLIRSAYTAYCGMVPAYTKTQQEHLYVAGFQAYSEILRNESSDIDLVGPTLASLKELCLASMSVYGDGLSRCVHGFLSANLNTLDDMRSRSGIVAVNKTKNALLATVVVITSLPNDVAVSQAVLEQYCYLLDQKLRINSNDNASLTIALTAINCLKTILLSASRRVEKSNKSNDLHPATAFCIGQTLTSLVTMLVNAHSERMNYDQDESGEEEKDVKKTTRIRTLEEAMKTLTGYTGIVQDEEHRTRLIGICLPTLSIYLLKEEKERNDTKIDQQLHSLAVHQILALARQYPSAFRTVVTTLPAEERVRVEQGVRTAVGMNDEQQLGNRQAIDGSMRNEAKKIELRSFG